MCSITERIIKGIKFEAIVAVTIGVDCGSRSFGSHKRHCRTVTLGCYN